MFKKFHWGHGITIFYIFFVAAVVTALVASFGVDHSLVVDDYYSQDLSYQSQYEKVQNSLGTTRVNIDNDASNKEIAINFVESDNIKGNAQFYRPSDKSQDFDVKLSGKETLIPTEKLLSGKWILKIDWSENGKAYYTEEIIFI